MGLVNDVEEKGHNCSQNDLEQVGADGMIA